jgi:deoxyribodipyrimidine photolyase-related protein
MRITVWMPGDQLLKDHPALDYAKTHTSQENIRVLMVESHEQAFRLPYQRKKLVLLFSAMRHYAEMLRESGMEVDYRNADTTAAALQAHLADFKPDLLVAMSASTYAGRRFQRDLEHRLQIRTLLLPNTMFLVESFNPYPNPQPGKRYVMENFYREMRRHHRILLDEADQPVGGVWNFDKENRKPLPRSVIPPEPLTFPPDALTQQVMREMETLDSHVGAPDGFALAVTHDDAERALYDFIDHRLADFGTYEDAMSAQHGVLFHSVLSPYVNIGLLTPMQMVEAALSAYEDGNAPINAVEGFIRQIIGWREYIYWQYWRQMPALRNANGWRGTRTMPRMFWDADTPMNCVHHVVKRLIDTGYTHHIERLMIICNFCLLAGVDPGEVADWFLTFYVDAYEWVVYPNVIGMGMNADGGQTATKPYIASANYIHNMSDYCAGCRFDPKQRTGERACPFNYLYWNFIIEHEALLRSNPRLGKNVLGLRHLDETERQRVQEQALSFLDGLELYESVRQKQWLALK